MTENDQIHPAGEQTLDTIFDLLCERRRRYAVEILIESDSRVPLGELAAAVAAREAEAGSGDVSARAVDEVSVLLHHAHLPKLAAADVVAYDPERKAAAPARTERVAPIVEAIRNVE